MSGRAGNRGESDFSEAAEAKLWSIYNAEAEKHDKNLAQNWRGDMNATLIFAGLFSASLTAFIIESYKYLQPDPQDTTVAILQQVSNQLASIANASSAGANAATPFDASSQIPFEPPTSILVCNAFWFLSLGFSLISAMGATLVDQWVRRYLQATQRRSDPASRARVRAYLFHGLQHFQMDTIVEIIPMLLHVSLLLFFAGLFAFISPLNRAIGAICLVLLTAGVLLYLACTLLPLFRYTCPFQTPLSNYFWGLSRNALRLWCSRSTVPEKTHSLTEWKEQLAVQDRGSRAKQDIQSLGWLVRSLADDEQIELLAEALPPLSHGSKSWKALFPDILASPDGFEIGKALVRLLQSCLDDSVGYAKQQSRFRICLSAVYWLTVLPFSGKLYAEGTNSRYWLDACSAEIIAVLSDPNSNESRTLQIEDYLSCAYVSVLSKSLLDAQINIMLLKEQISPDPKRKPDLATFQRLSNYPLFWSEKLPRLSYFRPSNWLLKFHFHSYVRLKTISLNPLNRLDRNPSDLGRLLNDLETSIAQNQFVIFLEYLRNALVSLMAPSVESTVAPYEFDRTVSMLWNNLNRDTQEKLDIPTCMLLVEKVYKHHVTKGEHGGLWRWRLKYDDKLQYDDVYMDLSRIRARPVPPELSQDYLDAIDFVMECVWRMSEAGQLLNVGYGL